MKTTYAYIEQCKCVLHSLLPSVSLVGDANVDQDDEEKRLASNDPVHPPHAALPLPHRLRTDGFCPQGECLGVHPGLDLVEQMDVGLGLVVQEPRLLVQPSGRRLDVVQQVFFLVRRRGAACVVLVGRGGGRRRRFGSRRDAEWLRWLAGHVAGWCFPLLVFALDFLRSSKSQAPPHHRRAQLRTSTTMLPSAAATIVTFGWNACNTFNRGHTQF